MITVKKNQKYGKWENKGTTMERERGEKKHSCIWKWKKKVAVFFMTHTQTYTHTKKMWAMVMIRPTHSCCFLFFFWKYVQQFSYIFILIPNWLKGFFFFHIMDWKKKGNGKYIQYDNDCLMTKKQTNVPSFFIIVSFYFEISIVPFCSFSKKKLKSRREKKKSW